MVSSISSPVGILSVILIIISVIMGVAGIIMLLVQMGQSKDWWVWFLLIMSIVLGIVGGVLLAIVLSKVPCCPVDEQKYLINLDDNIKTETIKVGVH